MKCFELREYKWNEYVTIAVNPNLSNCEKARKKDFGASTGFEPVASALALQCSTSLSYEDPHTGGRPIYWVHQPVKGIKHRMKWCELREYKWNEYVTVAVNRNLSNCEKARKKDFRASTGFETVASALALQCSTSLSYEDPYTGGRPIYWVHQPVKGIKHRMKWCELREYKWNEYVTIAVNRKWVCDHRSEYVTIAVNWFPLKPRNPFFRAFSQLLKLRFTAMVTYSFHFGKHTQQMIITH